LISGLGFSRPPVCRAARRTLSEALDRDLAHFCACIRFPLKGMLTAYFNIALQQHE